jgi:hypothetical protein
MKISLIHPFRFAGPWDKLLKSVDNLGKFENRIKKYCDEDTQHLTPEEAKNKINKFKGDAFEVFVEMLLKTHAYDRRIGICNYEPLHPLFGDQDTGVDGKGIGTNNRPATVQIKFRGDDRILLTANKDHLSNFLCASIFKHNVDKDDNENMLVITNAKGLHYFTETEMLDGKIRCLGRDHRDDLVKNNLPFWDAFRYVTLPIIESTKAISI